LLHESDNGVSLATEQLKGGYLHTKKKTEEIGDKKDKSERKEYKVVLPTLWRVAAKVQNRH
jgi:hypothetical protein